MGIPSPLCNTHAVQSRCPRPDKLGFDTEEEARERNKTLLLTEPTLAIYQCVCGKWHAGRHEANEERNRPRSTPRITVVSAPPEPAPPPVRRRQRASTPRPSSVTSITVNKKVWKDALRRADGDITRIQVLSEEGVIVHNNGNWRRRRT
jgi:hypothetical protein